MNLATPLGMKQTLETVARNLALTQDYVLIFAENFYDKVIKKISYYWFLCNIIIGCCLFINTRTAVILNELENNNIIYKKLPINKIEIDKKKYTNIVKNFFQKKKIRPILSSLGTVFLTYLVHSVLYKIIFIKAVIILILFIIIPSFINDYDIKMFIMNGEKIESKFFMWRDILQLFFFSTIFNFLLPFNKKDLLIILIILLQYFFLTFKLYKQPELIFDSQVSFFKQMSPPTVISWIVFFCFLMKSTIIFLIPVNKKIYIIIKKIIAELIFLILPIFLIKFLGNTKNFKLFGYDNTSYFCKKKTYIFGYIITSGLTLLM